MRREEAAAAAAAAAIDTRHVASRPEAIQGIVYTSLICDELASYAKRGWR